MPASTYTATIAFTIALDTTTRPPHFVWNPMFRPGEAQPNNATTFTDATPSLVGRSPVGPNNGQVVSVEGRNIKVRGAVALKFTFPQTSPDHPELAAFYPVGLSCSREENNANAAIDADSLPREFIRFGSDPRPGGGPDIPYVQLLDLFTARGQAGNFKYYIIIQSNFGEVGIIDPDIENENDPAI